MIRKVLAVLAVAGAALGIVGLWHPVPVDATSHSAVRSFSAPWVLPGGRLEVTIAVSDYGGFGQVVETLPSGFSYEGSDLSEAAVAVDGQTVAFTLLGDERFTYTVAAPGAEGPHSFSGVLLDSHLIEQAVGGDSSIRVGPAPTPTPTPTPRLLLRPRRRRSLLLRPHRSRRHTGADAHARANSHANANSHSHANAGADAGAYGHANAGARDRNPHSHSSAGAHPHQISVGCPPTASDLGT